MKQPLDYSQLTKRDLQILQMGRAGMIPGLQIAIDILEEQLSNMKAEMYQLQHVLQGNHAAAQPVAVSRRLAAPKRGKKRGRPSGASEASAGYWAKMTVAERKAEMARRQAVHAAKVAKMPNHPRHKDHPGHAAWLAKLSKSQNKRWKGLSPAEQKRHIKTMLTARRAKRQAGATPVAMLEKTA